MTALRLLVEGLVDEAVGRRLCEAAGLTVSDVFGKRGAGYIKSKIGGFDRSAAGSPLLTLVDFVDTGLACPPALVEQWVPHRHEDHVFRVAVKEIESWILADRAGVAAWLGVAERLLPTEPEGLPDPKRALVNVARRSPGGSEGCSCPRTAAQPPSDVPTTRPCASSSSPSGASTAPRSTPPASPPRAALSERSPGGSRPAMQIDAGYHAPTVPSRPAMHPFRLLPIALTLLVLLPACRPPEDIEAPPTSPSGDPGAAAREHKATKDKLGRGGEDGAAGPDDTQLSRNGLGKEDFALVEAELGCVRSHFAADETLRGRAEAAVYMRYGASEQWVERVRVHLKSEGKYKGKIEDAVAMRTKQVCPDGTVDKAMLDELDALLRKDGSEGIVPVAGGARPADAPAKEPADGAKPADAAPEEPATPEETPAEAAE